MLLVVIGIGAIVVLTAIVLAIVMIRSPSPDEGRAPAPNQAAAAPARPLAARAPGAPMVVTQMATRGFFALEDASGTREEPLPPSPLGHGEFPMGLWVAPDHTLFAVGKLYTGRAGPDEGVVWRRDPDGRWSFALRLPGRVIGHVTGLSSSQVLVGTMGGIAVWDGAGWTEHALPYAMMWKVWPDADGLVAQAFDGSASYLVANGLPTMTHAREEPRIDRYAFVRDGSKYRVFDRSTPIGPITLDPGEAAQIRRELAQVQAALARGEGRKPPEGSGID